MSDPQREAPKQIISTAFSMPNPWTFSMHPVTMFLARHLAGASVIVDPFCGESQVGTHRNDLAQSDGIDAELFVRSLISSGLKADAVLFDPPYSPRQIAECYRNIGREPAQQDTQNGRLYKRVRAVLCDILKPGGVALSFGWQSTGFGKEWETLEILLVQHGGAHNDTICVAQLAPGKMELP